MAIVMKSERMKGLYRITNDTSIIQKYTVQPEGEKSYNLSLYPKEYHFINLMQGGYIWYDNTYSINLQTLPNCIEHAGQLTDIRENAPEKHDEFIIIEDKFTLEGFGGANWVAVDVEQEVIYDGGLNFGPVEFRQHFPLNNPSSTTWYYRDLSSTYLNKDYIKATIISCKFNNTDAPITTTVITNNSRYTSPNTNYGSMLNVINFTLTDAVWGPLGVSVLVRIEKRIA